VEQRFRPTEISDESDIKGGKVMNDMMKLDRSLYSVDRITKFAAWLAICTLFVLVFRGEVVTAANTEDACLSKLMRFAHSRNISPDQETYNLMQQYCRQGEGDKAANVLRFYGRYTKCVSGLDDYIAANDLNPDLKSYKNAVANCRKIGDLAAAKKALRTSPEKPSNKQPPPAANILSFKASSRNIKKGETVTFTWRTSKADKVTFGQDNGEPRKVQTSGSLQIRPSQTTTYRLWAHRGAMGTSDVIKVEVRSPPAVAKNCSISGRVTGKLRDQGFRLTQVGIFVPGDWSKPKSVVSVNNSGRYKFTRVPGEQEFNVAPIGGWRYDRRNKTVSCFPGRSYTVNFQILGMMVD
jgi:plastocyanin